MIKNLNSLLELAAGHSYKVLDVTDTMVSVLHRKCGNEFISTVTDIARAGFSCPRCNETRADKMLTTLQNEHSKELYEAIKAKLPAGYNIFGSTKSVDEQIKVVYAGGEFTILISDLLNDRNLPDCLIHRSSTLVPSVQLQIIDLFMEEHEEILDDFTELTDEIRIKDNKLGVIKTTTVEALLEGIMSRYGKNTEQDIHLR